MSGEKNRRVDSEIAPRQICVDLLVNNAGYGPHGAVEQCRLAEVRQIFEVNVFGLARLTHLLLPRMRERAAGRIINISSIGGKLYEPLGAWCHAARFAVEEFSDSLRVELRPFGIHAVMIEPAPIITEWNVSHGTICSGTAWARSERLETDVDGGQWGPGDSCT